MRTAIIHTNKIFKPIKISIQIHQAKMPFLSEKQNLTNYLSETSIYLVSFTKQFSLFFPKINMRFPFFRDPPKSQDENRGLESLHLGSIKNCNRLLLTMSHRYLCYPDPQLYVYIPFQKQQYFCTAYKQAATYVIN